MVKLIEIVQKTRNAQIQNLLNEPHSDYRIEVGNQLRLTYGVKTTHRDTLCQRRFRILHARAERKMVEQDPVPHRLIW